MTQNTHKFWVVTRPTAVSTLGDILFETDARGLILQALGGLKSEDVLLTTSDVNEAQALAAAALRLETDRREEFRIYVGADAQEHGEY